MLLVAGVLTLGLLVPLLRRSISELRRRAAAFIITLVVLAVILLAWAALW